MTPRQSVSTGHPFVPGYQPGVDTGKNSARVGIADARRAAAPGRRLSELDALRGVAAIVVLLHHSLQAAGH